MIIVINPVEPAALSIRHPLGIDLALDLAFVSQKRAPVDPTPLMPQLTLLPRSQGGVYAYDVETVNAAGGTGHVDVPGTALTDVRGYNVELYFRQAAANPDDPPKPYKLAAAGSMLLQGLAYMRQGPHGMINVPVVVGPPGAPGVAGTPGAPGSAGADGRRGSIWTTGSGNPAASGSELPGDMYLDNATGNVWRWDGATWVLGTF